MINDKVSHPISDPTRILSLTPLLTVAKYVKSKETTKGVQQKITIKRETILKRYMYTYGVINIFVHTTAKPHPYWLAGQFATPNIHPSSATKPTHSPNF